MSEPHNLVSPFKCKKRRHQVHLAPRTIFELSLAYWQGLVFQGSWVEYQ